MQLSAGAQDVEAFLRIRLDGLGEPPLGRYVKLPGNSWMDIHSVSLVSMSLLLMHNEMRRPAEVIASKVSSQSAVGISRC